MTTRRERDLDNAALADFFGPPISVYTRAQAIEDGTLIDVTETAREAGFRCPVALTRAVWIDCVQWTDADRTTERRRCQDEQGRLWDVLWLASYAMAGRTESMTILYGLHRVPRRGNKTLVTLKLHIGPGDAGEPVVTVMFPEED